MTDQDDENGGSLVDSDGKWQHSILVNAVEIRGSEWRSIVNDREQIIEEAADLHSYIGAEVELDEVTMEEGRASREVRRFSSIMATPPKLMAAIFPWDLEGEGEGQRMKKQIGDGVKSDNDLSCSRGAEDGAFAKGKRTTTAMNTDDNGKDEVSFCGGRRLFSALPWHAKTLWMGVGHRTQDGWGLWLVVFDGGVAAGWPRFCGDASAAGRSWVGARNIESDGLWLLLCDSIAVCRQ